MNFAKLGLALLLGCIIGATVNRLASPLQIENAYLDGQSQVYKEARQCGYGNFDGEGNWVWYPNPSGRKTLIERD